MDYQQLANKLLEHGDRRSEPFLQGLIAVLRNRIEDVVTLNPYEPGSVEFDAFHAGNIRGHNEWRNALIEANSDRKAAISRLESLVTERRVA